MNIKLFSCSLLSPAPACIDNTEIDHFASAHMLFHSCLTRILRGRSCICVYALFLKACITQTHSTFSFQCHNALVQQSDFFIHKGSGNTEPLSAFSALDLNPSWSGSQRRLPLNVNAVHCARRLVVHKAAYSTLKSFSAPWNGFITAEEVSTAQWD